MGKLWYNISYDFKQSNVFSASDTDLESSVMTRLTFLSPSLQAWYNALRSAFSLKVMTTGRTPWCSGPSPHRSNIWAAQTERD